MLRRNRISLLLLILCPTMCVARSACAEENVLSHVPPTALGYAVVNRLGEASKKVEHIAKRLGMPIPSPLAFLEAAGVSKGLNVEGSALILAMSGKPKEESEEEEVELPIANVHPFVLLPVTDYVDFVRQFGAQDPKEEVIEVPVAATPMLIGRRGSFAVLAEPDQKEQLVNYLAEDFEAQAEFAKLLKWGEEQDIYVGSTHQSTSLLFESGLKELNAASERVEQYDREGIADFAENLKRARALLQKYETNLTVCQEEIKVAAVGLKLDKELNLLLTAQILFQPEGKLAQWAALPRQADTDFLAGLPAGDFVYAGGFTLSPAASRRLSELQSFSYSGLLRSDVVLRDSKQLESMHRTTEEILTGVKAFSFSFGPGEDRDALYQNLTAVLQVENSKSFLEQYATFAEHLSELSKQGGTQKSAWEIKSKDVADHPGLVVIYDSLAHYDTDFVEFLRKINSYIFGPEGKHTTYFSAMNDRTVAATCVSEARLRELVAVAEKKSDALSTNESLRAAESLLPGEWDAKLFFSPHGAAQMAQRLRRMNEQFANAEVIEFPATQPAVLGGRTNSLGVEVQLAVPAETWDGGFIIVRELMEAWSTP